MQLMGVQSFRNDLFQNGVQPLQRPRQRLIALKIIFQVHYDSFFAWSRPLQNGKRHAAIHPISPTAKKDRPRAVFSAYSFFLPIDDPRCFKQYIGSLGQICIVGELLRTVGDPAVVARDENQPGIPDAPQKHRIMPRPRIERHAGVSEGGRRPFKGIDNIGAVLDGGAPFEELHLKGDAVLPLDAGGLLPQKGRSWRQGSSAQRSGNPP